MRKMKWVYLLVLAVCILAGFGACRGRTDRRSSGQTGWPGPEPQDLGGIVFKIADSNAFRFFPSAGEIGTPLGDAKQAAMESIEEDFNITFEIIQVAENDIRDRLSPAVWAGDMFAHMVITTQWAYGYLIGAELLGDLGSVPTLNLDSDLWVQDVHRVTTVRGEILATAGIFDHWERNWAVFFNKNMWNELNLPDPYEIVRRGEWTWDRLQEFGDIAQQDLTGDGVVDSPDDLWGLVATTDDLLRAWYTGMGGLYFDFHPVTGRLYLPVATNDGIALADYMRRFSERPGLYFRGAGQTTASRIEMFANRRALFYPQALLLPSGVRAMRDDFGVLPMPKRDVQQQTYLSNVNQNALLIGITRTNNQLEETGIIMEAMAARFYKVRELQRAELEDIILRSDEDIEMLDYIIPYPVYDIGHIMARAASGFVIPQNTLSQYVTNHTIGDFASVMEANRESIEIQVNEMFFGQ